MQFELLHYDVIWCNNSVFIFRFGFGFGCVRGSASTHLLFTQFANIIMCYNSHVDRFRDAILCVGRTMWRYQATDPSQKLHFFLFYFRFCVLALFFSTPAKLYWSHGQSQSEFISLMNFNSLTSQRLNMASFIPFDHLHCYSFVLYACARLQGAHLPF